MFHSIKIFHQVQKQTNKQKKVKKLQHHPHAVFLGFMKALQESENYARKTACATNKYTTHTRFPSLIRHSVLQAQSLHSLHNHTFMTNKVSPGTL